MIKFINHAGFIFKNQNFNLLIDPWFSGSSFDNGWDLISKTKIENKELKKVTHIWFSHEHPDHFSVKDLKYIYNLNKDIKILFQETLDKRVVSFCKNLGFTVIEVKNYQKYFFDRNSYIQIIKCGLLDSFAIIKDSDHIIVNMNDCVPQDDLYKIKDFINVINVDVLFTQFSYADWNGNSAQGTLRKKAVEKKFQQIEEQINFFRPKYIVPFASYIYFSNEENFFMNDEIPKISLVEKMINKNFLHTSPIILYPNEDWDYNLKDNFESIKKYENDLTQISIKHIPSKVNVNELINLSKLQVKKIKKINGNVFMFVIFLFQKLFKKGFQSINIYVKDIDTYIYYDFYFGLKVIDKCNKKITINSEALSTILKFEWGIGTIIINGRFYLENMIYLDNLRSAFSIPIINSNGITVFKYYLNKILNKKSQNIIDDYRVNFNID